MKSKHLASALIIFALAIALGTAAIIGVGSKPARLAAKSVTGTHFNLINQAGELVSDATYRGRWLLLFFGFTRCPDVCPESLIFAGDLLKSLGPQADRLQVAFVTVDPERDTPSVLADYLANFDPRIVGLTGSPRQVAAAAQTFDVYYAKRPLEGQDDYTMDHSNAFYLVNPEGGFHRIYALQRGAAVLTDELRDVIVNGPSASANAASPGIEVSGAWVRPSMGQSQTTAAYLKVENRGTQADRLLSISAPAAGMAHLHESVANGSVMEMRGVDGLTIKPGATVELKPGGLHIMIMNLGEPLKTGQTMALKLQFEHAGEIEIKAEVKMEAPEAR